MSKVCSGVSRVACKSNYGGFGHSLSSLWKAVAQSAGTIPYLKRLVSHSSGQVLVTHFSVFPSPYTTRLRDVYHVRFSFFHFSKPRCKHTHQNGRQRIVGTRGPSHAPVVDIHQGCYHRTLPHHPRALGLCHLALWQLYVLLLEWCSRIPDLPGEFLPMTWRQRYQTLII